MSMGCWTAAKMVPPDDTGKTAPLADADYIHIFLGVEDIHQNLIAHLGSAAIAGFTLRSFFRRLRCGFSRRIFHGNLTYELHRRQVVLGKVTLHRHSHVLAFYRQLHQADLGSFVAVLRGPLKLRNHAWPSLQHRDRVNLTLVVKELRHADFFTKYSVDHCFLSSSFLQSSSLVAPSL